MAGERVRDPGSSGSCVHAFEDPHPPGRRESRPGTAVPRLRHDGGSAIAGPVPLRGVRGREPFRSAFPPARRSHGLLGARGSPSPSAAGRAEPGGVAPGLGTGNPSQFTRNRRQRVIHNIAILCSARARGGATVRRVLRGPAPRPEALRGRRPGSRETRVPSRSAGRSSRPRQRTARTPGTLAKLGSARASRVVGRAAAAFTRRGRSGCQRPNLAAERRCSHRNGNGTCAVPGAGRYPWIGRPGPPRSRRGRTASALMGAVSGPCPAARSRR